MDESAVEVVTSSGPALRADVADLLDRTVRPDGSPALSEDRRRALGGAPDGDSGFVAVTARDTASGRLVGYAQADHQGDRETWSLELVAPPDAGSLAGQLVDTALDAVRAGGGGRVRLWVGYADRADDLSATTRGFVVERDLLQLRCPLPATGTAGEAPVTRPFRIGSDEEAWLVANNRAFADHPEQGHWDLATLEAREAEAWFDPDGFRVLDVGGRIAGSCWTKIHASTVPPMGEIYVISVDPDFHGRGWGRGLTLAGLDWLADAGLTTGMLYVDAANAPAVGLYGSMGFTVHHVDRAYVVDLTD